MLGGNDKENKTTDTEFQTVINTVASKHPFGVPSFMRVLDLEAMNAPEFFELTNLDGEFAIRMEFSSRKSVVMAIRNYTISKEVDYKVFESEPLTFYSKCLQYGRSCDWLLRANLIKRKYC
ncbi:hypothetical protein Ahy_A09g043563 [Arachis hypogaea]|uniref:Uncharacterized protein n=1 Tax=Arachis hypogaea TaxID=3818 RepID=A0A445BIK5_ARAHY|nr:hypothetical protein Ahy_A09g043563 [Arachis hypogaea]